MVVFLESKNKCAVHPKEAAYRKVLLIEQGLDKVTWLCDDCLAKVQAHYRSMPMRTQEWFDNWLQQAKEKDNEKAHDLHSDVQAPR